MSSNILSCSDLCAGVLLIEKDFIGVKKQLIDLKLIDFDNELKSRCSSVFHDQLQRSKKIIEESGVKNRLAVIKENLNSCVVVSELPSCVGQLGFVGDRVSEVRDIANQKISELKNKVGKFDRYLTRLCFLIDSHLASPAINHRLVEVISTDLTLMNRDELNKVDDNLKKLEQDQNKWFHPRSKFLCDHFSTHHKDEIAAFQKGLAEVKLKLRKELFLGDVVFVLDGLKGLCQKTGAISSLSIEQRFATFPPELQWQIFQCAGILTDDSFACLEYKTAAMNMPQSFVNAVDKENEMLRSALLRHACLLFINPEKALIGCLNGLKAYSDPVIDDAMIAQYSIDIAAKSKSAVMIESEASDPFGMLKELIRINIKSNAPEENIGRLLAAAEDSGLDLRGPRGVYFWVWFFAHQLDPKAGGPSFGMDNAHKDVERLLLAIDETTLTPEQLLERYNSASISSLGQLKAEIGKIKMHLLNVEQREGIVHAVLSAALRGGIALAAPNGIYHWVWAIASKTDSWAHGANWGCNNAHKNIDRLLEAIDKSS